MLGWSHSHSTGYQRLNIQCTLYGFASNSNLINPSTILLRKHLPSTESFLSSFCCLAHWEDNRSKHLVLQVFGWVLRRLYCCSSSWLPCGLLFNGTIKESVLSSLYSFVLFGSSIPKSLIGDSAGKRSMSIVHVLAGQSLRPGFFFSAIRLSNFSRRWLRKGPDCISLRCEGTGALWNESWKVAISGKPVNWLLARHSVWLLFGLCTCSIATGTGSLLNPPALAEPLVDDNGSCIGPTMTASASSHGKQVLTNYSVIGIPGDGRCLFRAVAHGAHVRKGLGVPSESLQRESADALRGKVVDELVRRREETEWFIEGDFDSYTKRMRQSHVWGGEPELLMASHVLRMPITVYMFEQRSRGLISIAEYGQEYAKENSVPIRVLYDGFGHYDALQLPGHET